MKTNNDGYWKFMFWCAMTMIALLGLMRIAQLSVSDGWKDGFSEGYRYGLKTHDTPEDPDVALVRWNKDKR